MNSVSLYKQFSKHLFCHFTNYIRMSESSLSVTSLFCSGSRKIENSQIERHFLACIAFSLKVFSISTLFQGSSCFAFRLEENAHSEDISLFWGTYGTLSITQCLKIYESLIFENLKFTVNQCYQTGQFKQDKKWRKMLHFG